jgi:hypothetical protein
METPNPCICGETPSVFPPTLSKSQLGTDPNKVPGKFYSTIMCKCGLSLDGPDFDSNCSQVISHWNNLFKMKKNLYLIVKTIILNGLFQIIQTLKKLA